MADDLISLLGAGGSVVASGGASWVVVRALFGSMKEQLAEISTTLKASVVKADERHERLVQVESKADAAHRRLDELNRQVEDLQRRRGRR
jgi:uncharacterized coiled-coil DUF342 family protein